MHRVLCTCQNKVHILARMLRRSVRIVTHLLISTLGPDLIYRSMYGVLPGSSCPIVR